MGDVSQQPAAAQSERKPQRSLRRTALIFGGVVLLLVLTVVFAVSVLPRWWAERVGHQVDGDLTTGAFVGFFYGFLAMLLPILVLWLVWRLKRDSVWAWVVGVGIALVLAAPNWITLGITLGTGGSAHAADRTLDVNAPWYRGGTVVGVAAALLVVGYVAYVLGSRSRARRREREAREGLEAHERAHEPPAPPS